MRETGFDWTNGPRWTVGQPAQRVRLAATRNSRWLVVVAISAAAAATAALAFTGVAARGATLYPCAGAPADAPQTMYPEKRIYLETQAWWTPMPGHSPDEPFQDRTGHIHLSACVPLYQTVSGGTLHLDLKWQEHMMQGVNGQGAPVPTNFIVNIEGVFKGPNLRNLGLWPGVPCTTMQCEGWVSADFDYSKAPSGWGNLNPFIQDFFTDCPESAPNCRQLRTLNHWPVNFVTGNPPIANDSVLAPGEYTGGESWFTPEAGGSRYARTFVARTEISKLWNIDTGQLVPKSGVFHITIGGEKDGNRALIDPKLHNMPPVLGTVLLDEPPVTGALTYKNYDLAIDTTKLTDGAHRLFFQNIYKRASGEQSGVIVLPFLVANAAPPPSPTTTPTTSTTTNPNPGSTSTSSPTTTAPPPAGHVHHTPCKARCRVQPTRSLGAKHTKLGTLRARLSHERATNAKLRRQIERLRKALKKRAP